MDYRGVRNETRTFIYQASSDGEDGTPVCLSCARTGPGLGGRPDGHSVVRPASPQQSAGSPDGEEIQSHDGLEDLRRAHDKASEVRSGRQQAAKSRSPGSDLFALLLRNWQIPQVRSQVQARFRRNNPPAASCSVRIAKSEPCRRIYQAPGRNNPWEQIC